MGKGRRSFLVILGSTKCVLSYRTASLWGRNDVARILTRKSSASLHITKVVMRSRPCTPTARCLCTKLPACPADMHLESCVSNIISYLPNMPDDSDAGQTSQLPKDDRLMVTQKEFLADIDVALGGRVAEELIFGPENVTSGASSDLRKATATATRMVKASQVHPVVYQMVNMTFCLVHRIGDTRKRSARCIITIAKRASPRVNVRRLRTKYGGEGGFCC
jgi:hypothetical protein